MGSRIDFKALEHRQQIAVAPLIVGAADSGCAVLFRFGVAVLVGLDSAEEKAFLNTVISSVSEPFDNPEKEEVRIIVDPSREERVDPSGNIVLHEFSTERIQLIAHILAKSTVLSHYEERVAHAFDRIEKLAELLRLGGRRPIAARELLQQIADVLLIQMGTVGRAEVTEKPEITWDRPELDRLYERLAIEYELRDRDVALTRKLDLVSRTAETYHDLLQNRRMLRVEWYIVMLILVEIIIIVFDMLGILKW